MLSGALGTVLEPSWTRPGASWAYLGGVLGALGAVLSTLIAILETSWTTLGVVLRALGAVLAASWEPLAAFCWHAELHCVFRSISWGGSDVCVYVFRVRGANIGLS